MISGQLVEEWDEVLSDRRAAICAAAAGSGFDPVPLTENKEETGSSGISSSQMRRCVVKYLLNHHHLVKLF